MSSCPLWDYDDFPQCSRAAALYYYPLSVAGASVVFLSVKSIISFSKKKLGLSTIHKCPAPTTLTLSYSSFLTLTLLLPSMSILFLFLLLPLALNINTQHQHTT